MDSKTAAQLKELVGGINRLVEDCNGEAAADKSVYSRLNNYGPGYNESGARSPYPTSAPAWGEKDMQDMRNQEKITKECAAKKSEPSINDDLSVIFTQLDNMDYVFNALTEKLRPVIKPIPDSGINGCDPGARLPNSPVSEQLKNTSASIEALTGRIRFLTKSVDL